MLGKLGFVLAALIFYLIMLFSEVYTYSLVRSIKIASYSITKSDICIIRIQ